jgi:RNA-binding protein YhbY
VADALAEAANAEMIQVLGRTVLLYRARKQDPAIKLP